MTNDNKRGFTLVEIIIASALMVILAGVGIVAINPHRQIASARNNQRVFHLQAIMNSIRQNIADQSGQSFSCGAGAIPTSTKKMAVGAGNYNIAPCLVPIYILTLPFDPATSTARYTSNTDYDTGYRIIQATSTPQITLSAPAAELGKTITLTR